MLPCLYSELAQPALAKIVQELTGVEYLEHIVIGLDRATEAEYRHALEYFSVLPPPHTGIWNDGPRMASLQKRLGELGLAPTSLGKGCNVWYCFGFARCCLLFFWLCLVFAWFCLVLLVLLVSPEEFLCLSSALLCVFLLLSVGFSRA